MRGRDIYYRAREVNDDGEVKERVKSCLFSSFLLFVCLCLFLSSLFSFSLIFHRIFLFCFPHSFSFLLIRPQTSGYNSNRSGVVISGSSFPGKTCGRFVDAMRKTKMSSSYSNVKKLTTGMDEFETAVQVDGCQCLS